MLSARRRKEQPGKTKRTNSAPLQQSLRLLLPMAELAVPPICLDSSSSSSS
jgi:hypothetical protein